MPGPSDMLDPMEEGARDRIEGVLLAAACGDALGVPYEFGSAPLAPSEQPGMIGGGLGPYAPGEWSDDTQMAVVIARVAAGRGLWDGAALDDIVDGWVEWLDEGATDVGTQTRHVLRAVAAPDAGSAERVRAAARDLHRRTGRTAGNGSLMRTALVALAFLDDPAALTVQARTISELTHRDPLAGDACVIWCHAIRLAVLESTVPDLSALVAELPPERRDPVGRLDRSCRAASAGRVRTQRLCGRGPPGGVVRDLPPRGGRVADRRLADRRCSRG